MIERGSLSQRKLFSRWDILLLLLLLSLCALGFLLVSRSPRGAVAVVEQDGRELLRRELSQVESPEEIPVSGEGGVSLIVTLYPDGAAVTEADCPDQVCVRTGKITRAGESALCVPAKVSVRLEGQSAADAETY